jgi:hypothetical protein
MKEKIESVFRKSSANWAHREIEFQMGCILS